MAIPKLQLLEEEADDSPTAQAWDKSLPKKVLELAVRMATVAQAHSEWHRRMTSEKLNQANRPFDDSQLQPGMKSISINLHPSKKSLPRDARLNTLLTIMVPRP